MYSTSFQTISIAVINIKIQMHSRSSLNNEADIDYEYLEQDLDEIQHKSNFRAKNKELLRGNFLNNISKQRDDW